MRDIPDFVWFILSMSVFLFLMFSGMAIFVANGGHM